MNRWISFLVALLLLVPVVACEQQAAAPTVAPQVTAPPGQSSTTPPKPAATVQEKPAATAAPKPAVTSAATPAPAAGAYYQGKTIEIIAATGAGGGTDTTARAVAAFIPRYIPGNPKVIVRNQPGAGGVIAANSFFERAKPDGFTLLHGSSTIIASQQRTTEMIKYDLRKTPALGNIGGGGGLMGIRKGLMGRLTNKNAEPIVIATRGAEETSNLIPLYAKEFLGWNVRWVPGFSGTGEITLAFRRKEVDMFNPGAANLKDLMAEGLAEAVAQLGDYRDNKFWRRPDFADAPTLEELLGAKKPSGVPWQGFLAAYMPQTIYKFTVAPAGTPPNVMKILSDAYGKMNADKEFQEFMGKFFGEVYVISVGKDTETLINLALNVPPEAIDYVEGLVKKFGIN